MPDIRERDLVTPLNIRKLRTRVRRPLSRDIVAGTVQLLDFGIVIISGLAAFWVYLFNFLGSADDLNRYSLTSMLAALVFVLLMRWSKAYRFSQLMQLGSQVRQLTIFWGATVSVLTTWAFVTKEAELYSRGWSITFALLAFQTLLLSRVLLRLQFYRWRSQGRLLRSVAIVGAGQVGEELLAKLTTEAADEVEVVGIFDDRATRIPARIGGYPVLGTTDRLAEIGQATNIDEIIIALPLRAAERIGEIAAKLRLLPADLRLSIDPIGGAFPMRGVGAVGPVPVIEIVDRPLKNWRGFAKAVEDRSLSALLLIAAAPLMAVVALAIRLDSRGPVLFKQRRYGYNNAVIVVYKFRTLRVEATDFDAARLVSAGDPRVTRVGKFLRRFSLDELPQLFNVVRGEMSIVGPRPHAKLAKAGGKYYDQVVSDYIARHRVKPGLTGWAQVNGWRGETETEEQLRRRVECDLDYIENWSIWLDLKIILKTFLVILQKV